jgi:hypothetical protein
MVRENDHRSLSPGTFNRPKRQMQNQCVPT